MIFSLPNGKIIQLSLDQFLDLTDEDIQNMMGQNFGEHASSPWVGSAITKAKSKKVKTEEEEESEEEEDDRSIDYIVDDDDKVQGHDSAIEGTSLDDISDLPDEFIED